MLSLFGTEQLDKNTGGGIKYLDIALPIGLSFFTFQGLSYVIDVYRGNVFAQKNPFYVALYISLFPQLVAGPIVRYEDICKQLKIRDISLEDVYLGLQRFMLGLAKKVILADLLASVSDQIFSQPISELTTGISWLGATCYTLQIYYDFSGYSDMAIGLGKVFGFDFLENFNLPYLSHSMTEFWRRWHMSLSSWFRDYLYIPMGGNRKGNVYLHLFVVFLCTGLWHGAAFTFVLWGLWHGSFLIIERFFRGGTKIPKVPLTVKRVYTMLIVILGWVLFRSESIHYAIMYIKTMFGMAEAGFKPYTMWRYIDRQIVSVLIAAIFFCAGGGQWCLRKLEKKTVLWQLIQNVRLLLIQLLFILSILMVANGNYSPFIYFRF